MPYLYIATLRENFLLDDRSHIEEQLNKWQEITLIKENVSYESQDN
jgi:hypothetical protein